MITSPLPQDGKSTVALNLATALAEGGKRTVLLIEADLYHPTLTERLGLEVGLGLADCLEGPLHPVLALRRLEPLSWYLLSAGEPRSNPTDLFQTEALARVIQKLSTHFDWILIDSPPLTPLTDALSLARHTDATLLVAERGARRAKVLKRPSRSSDASGCLALSSTAWKLIDFILDITVIADILGRMT